MADSYRFLPMFRADVELEIISDLCFFSLYVGLFCRYVTEQQAGRTDR